MQAKIFTTAFDDKPGCLLIVSIRRIPGGGGGGGGGGTGLCGFPPPPPHLSPPVSAGPLEVPGWLYTPSSLPFSLRQIERLVRRFLRLW